DGVGKSSTWHALGAIALLLEGVAMVLQIWQLAHHLGFPPVGGYPSVFVGWFAFYVVVELGAMYWLGTLVSQMARVRGTGEMTGAELEVFRAQSAGFSFFWTFMAAVELLGFVLLYLVR